MVVERIPDNPVAGVPALDVLYIDDDVLGFTTDINV
jgi:hypothetical protein